MVEFHCLDPLGIERFLERRRASPIFPLEMSLAENLVAVLRKANQVVPSEAGSILLDNPVEKQRDHERNNLTFIAAFGHASDRLIGRRIPAAGGTAELVYARGDTYLSSVVGPSQALRASLDAGNGFETRSLVTIPIHIEKEVCGVMELANRIGEADFSQRDLELLKIFAGYISIFIQNVLDGRQAQEFAKRDNLTGLYNDRYLHIALTQAVSNSRRDGSDLAVLFIDLDFFKRVNDTHGHLTGSQVLREVGHLLHELAEPRGAIAARYGGDEYVVAAPGLGLTDAIDLAEAIREAIAGATFSERPSDIQPEVHYLKGITCSVGVASLNRHASEEVSVERCKSTLLRLADAAMYVAKDTGRNRTAVAGEPVRRRALRYD